MLKLSRKIDYALMSLVSLALSNKALSARSIAMQYGAPTAMIANILKELNTSGIIESRRGQSGGYLLAFPAEQVNIGHVMQAMNERVALVDCVSADCSCAVFEKCPVKNPLIALHQQLVSFVKQMTLEQLIHYEEKNYEIPYLS